MGGGDCDVVSVVGWGSDGGAVLLSGCRLCCEYCWWWGCCRCVSVVGIVVDVVPVVATVDAFTSANANAIAAAVVAPVAYPCSFPPAATSLCW